MNHAHKATRIDLFSLKTPQMRAFHMAWLTFFLAFFAWFGIAPLMTVVKAELGLTKEQIGLSIVASVSITILFRLGVGWLIDRIGPRITYSLLMMVSALPVIGIGLADSFESFLIFRLLIGMIGASFVITQYHTSVMFAPNVVGTANATSAGWGNLGGGVTQFVMPLLFVALVGAGFTEALSWRLALGLVGGLAFLAGLAYWFLTQDTPEGNFKDLRAQGRLPQRKHVKGSFRAALKDPRVWVLFVIYGACFGIELTLNNTAALYFTQTFALDLTTAGLIASLFGLMNIFARTLGGLFGDRFGKRFGLKGRVWFLAAVMLAEGLALILFSRLTDLPWAIAGLILFSTFVQMAEGATFSVVPFISRKGLGAVSGLVGAGGNVGAMAAGFLFTLPALSYGDAYLWLGIAVAGSAFLAPLVRFSPAQEAEALGAGATPAEGQCSSEGQSPGEGQSPAADLAPAGAPA